MTGVWMDRVNGIAVKRVLGIPAKIASLFRAPLRCAKGFFAQPANCDSICSSRSLWVFRGEGMHRETGSRTFADEAVGEDLGRNERLIHAAIDFGAAVDVLHSAREGRKAYPPLLMLLQHLHDLSDPGLEERLRNDLSWRRFVGLGLTDGTPDHTTISRFRNLVVERGLMRRVFEAVEHLDERGMVLRHGTVVDATLVEARASRPPSEGEVGREAEERGGPRRDLGSADLRLPRALRDRTARGWCGTPSSRRPTSTTR